MRPLPDLLLASLALLALPVAAADWINLIPPNDLKGWTRVAIPPSAPVQDVPQWKVEKAVLICEGNGGHDWLRYDAREFADFEMEVDWRFTKLPGEPRYNSGIFVRNNADGTIWHQAQTGPAGGWIFGVTQVAGQPQPTRINLRDKMTENRVKPAGEWNVYKIRVEDKSIRLDVNGQVTSEFNECLVPKGYVGFEAEGYRIEFRNARIRELK